MVQAALDLQLEPATYYLNGAPLARPRHTIADTFHAAPYGVYHTADGYLALSMTPVSALSEALGGVPALAPFEAPALATSKRGDRRDPDPDPAVQDDRGVDCGAAGAGIWCAPVNDYDQVFAEPRGAVPRPGLGDRSP